MRNLDGPGSVRWEAWSHPRIYDATQTGAVWPANSLAETVSRWRGIVADLDEVRARYVEAVRRLDAAGFGPNADAAKLASQQIRRKLAEARELAAVAGAKRAKLSELNERLRLTMPEPVATVEDSSHFLGRGLDWLTPPEFHARDKARLDAEEHARDLMRAYEEDVASQALTADAHDLVDGSSSKLSTQAGDEPTIPFPGKRIDDAVQAAPPQTDEPGRPLGDGAGRFSGNLGLITPAPSPSGYVWSWADFGPEGHAESDGDTDDGSDDDDGGTARAAGGAVPTLRDDGDEFITRYRLSDDDLFTPDVRAPGSVIGE
jgi:hypothetical protein